MFIYTTVDKDMVENDKTLVSSPRKRGLNHYCHSHFKQNKNCSSDACSREAGGQKDRGLCSPVTLKRVMRFHCKIAMEMLIQEYVVHCGESKWEMINEEYRSNISMCCDCQGLRQISLLLREVLLPKNHTRDSSFRQK